MNDVEMMLLNARIQPTEERQLCFGKRTIDKKYPLKFELSSY